MTNVFTPPPFKAIKDDGTHAHYNIMTMGGNDLKSEGGFVHCHKSVFNRVLIISDDLFEVGLIQSRLPKEFHEFEPVHVKDLIADDWRPEPFRVVYASQAWLDENHKLIGRYYFFTYSCIGKRTDGQWNDLRDQTSTRWGRVCEGWHSNPDTIRSEEVLNGLKTL